MTVNRKTYDALVPWQRRLCDEAYDAAREVIIKGGYVAANDDRAERLVEAIAVYLTESKV